MSTFENDAIAPVLAADEKNASAKLFADSNTSSLQSANEPAPKPGAPARTEASAAPEELSFEPINYIVDNPKQSEKTEWKGHGELPDLSRDQSVIHFENSTVVNRKGDHPDHRYEMTVNPLTGDASIKYADGRNLEIKVNPDGSRIAVSTGPNEKDNFEVRESTDRHTETLTYKDGRVFTTRYAQDKSFNSLSSRGPDKFDNFEMNADRQVLYWNPIATYQDYYGVKGLQSVDRYYDDALRVVFAKGNVSFAIADRYVNHRKLR